MITDTRRIASPDQNSLPQRARGLQFPASGFTQIDDLAKLPVASEDGREQYQHYLKAGLPKAFAISPNHQQWAWKAGGDGDVNAQALQHCEERAKEACVLYGVDDNVVYKP